MRERESASAEPALGAAERGDGRAQLAQGRERDRIAQGGASPHFTTDHLDRRAQRRGGGNFQVAGIY